MNIAQVDLNLLTAFEALMAERSVSRAAARLGVGQPAASHALSRLRLLFRDDLLVRQGRSMVPTARALAIAEPVGRALAAAREAMDPPDGFVPASSNRVFRISGGDYALSTVLPGLTARLRQAAPGLDLRFRFVEKDRVTELLDDGALDLALGVFPQAPKRFLVQPVCADRFVCVTRQDNPALAGGLTMQSYAAAPHVLVTERGDARGVVDEALAAAGLRRRIALTVPSVLVVRRLLLASDMIATIGARVATTLADDPRLAVRELPFAMARWHLQQMCVRRAQPDAGVVWLAAQVAAAAEG